VVWDQENTNYRATTNISRESSTSTVYNDVILAGFFPAFSGVACSTTVGRIQKKVAMCEFGVNF